MKNSKKKKRMLAAGSALALIAAVSGTFAWISAQDQKINRVSTAAIKDGSVTVVENWQPKPIIPGTDATKEVAVTNTGTLPVYVRVAYEEVLKSLTNKGASVTRAVGFGAVDPETPDPETPDPDTRALTDDVPVEFDGAKYINDATFTDVTAQVKDSAGVALPAGVQVWAKGSVTVDPVTGEEAVTFDYAMFYEYDTTAHKYQAMKSNVNVVTAAANSAVNTWQLVATEALYEVYADGYKYTVANWANSSLEGASAEATAIKASLLGSTGTKYNVTYDYTADALGLTLPTQATPGTGNKAPTTAEAQSEVQTDTEALGKSGIQIKYGPDMVNTTDIANNKWVYNKEDGYFYFTSPLPTGDTTPDLLKKLVFTNEVGTEFTNATFDLIVKMESIQGTKEALGDSADWSLQGGTDKPETTKIKAFLETQAASR